MSIFRSGMFGMLAAALFAAQAPTAYANDDMTRDQKFIKHAMKHNMFEIKMAEMVAEKASDNEVQQFARRLHQDHKKANEQLKQLAQRMDVELPDDLADWQEEKLDKMSDMSGEELEMAYVFGQVGAHHIAILQHKCQANKGENSQVSNLAKQMIPALESHLEEAENLAKRYTGEEDDSSNNAGNRNNRDRRGSGGGGGSGAGGGMGE